MGDSFTEELCAERANLERLLREAEKPGRREALGEEGSKQFVEAIRHAIDSLDASLKIIADAKSR